jgi:hypothetical protein
MHVFPDGSLERVRERRNFCNNDPEWLTKRMNRFRQFLQNHENCEITRINLLKTWIGFVSNIKVTK